MLNFRLAKWSAVAPGLTSPEGWDAWLHRDAAPSADDNIKPALKKIPPMLRRRFTPMGKIAAAALSELDINQNIPLVFASRHGDVDLTLTLLQNIAQDNDLSPTSFSLAVHNATAGLLSIARKDISTITSIAACQQMLPMALLEAITQLQDFEQVMCLICDTPIPEIYRPYTDSSEIAYAIALLLSREDGIPLSLEQRSDNVPEPDIDTDYKNLLSFLLTEQIETQFCPSSATTCWALKRT